MNTKDYNENRMLRYINLSQSRSKSPRIGIYWEKDYDACSGKILVIGEEQNSISIMNFINVTFKDFEASGMGEFSARENVYLNLFTLSDIDKSVCDFIMENYDVVLINAFHHVVSTAIRDANGKLLRDDRGSIIYDVNRDGNGLDVAYELIKICPDLKDRLALIYSQDEYEDFKSSKQENDERISFLENSNPIIHHLNYFGPYLDDEIIKFFGTDPRACKKTKNHFLIRSLENYLC